MKIFKNSDSDIIKLSDIVKHGGIIVFPTDTVYGIGCDPFNEKAIEKIFHIKQRRNKPLPVLCQSIDYARKLVEFNEILNKFALKFWPGPLTIVAPIKNHALPKLLTINSDLLGIRVLLQSNLSLHVEVIWWVAVLIYRAKNPILLILK